MNSHPGEPFLGSNRESRISYCSLRDGGPWAKSVLAMMSLMDWYSSSAFEVIWPVVANAKPMMPVVCSPAPVVLESAK